jgi:hypothetical protein
LGLAVILSTHLVRMFQDFEILQEKLLKPSTNIQIKYIKNSMEEISAEFYRCRRYNHTLSVLSIEPTLSSVEYQEQVAQKSQKKMLRRFITINLAEVISQQIRQFDIILIQEWNGRFYILCPENNAEGSQSLAKRINDITQKNLGITINYGFAVFPKDALTFEELVGHAEINMQEKKPEFNQNQEIIPETEDNLPQPPTTIQSTNADLHHSGDS